MSNGQHYDWAKLIRQVGGKIDSRHIQKVRRTGHGPHGPDVAHEPFECPSCGDRFPVPDLCPRCVAVPFDARSGLRLEEHVIVPAHGIGLVTRLRVQLVEAARRRAAAWARRVSTRVRRARPVRLRGVVNVLRPVVPPGGEHEPCGAYLRRREVVEPCGCRDDCPRRTRLLREESAVGLIALHVDDEVVLAGVPRSVHRVGSLRSGFADALLLRDGMEAELVGVLEQRVVDLPRTTGYRETPDDTSLCIVGTVGRPCWVLV